MNWIELSKIDDLEAIKTLSSEIPCVIFKHSTRCSISSIAKHRLEKSWDFETDDVKIYYLDLIQNRNISNQIVEEFQVQHASPQLLLIEKGVCSWNTSHLDISVKKLKSQLS